MLIAQNSKWSSSFSDQLAHPITTTSDTFAVSLRDDTAAHGSIVQTTGTQAHPCRAQCARCRRQGERCTYANPTSTSCRSCDVLPERMRITVDQDAIDTLRLYEMIPTSQVPPSTPPCALEDLNTATARGGTAMWRTLNTAELLEGILGHLPIYEMCRLQRTSKHFLAILSRSARMRELNTMDPYILVSLRSHGLPFMPRGKIEARLSLQASAPITIRLRDSALGRGLEGLVNLDLPVTYRCRSHFDTICMDTATLDEATSSGWVTLYPDLPCPISWSLSVYRKVRIAGILAEPETVLHGPDELGTIRLKPHLAVTGVQGTKSKLLRRPLCVSAARFELPLVAKDLVWIANDDWTTRSISA
ncbi:hypothetical protein D0861_04513 [Hortaea werneckii]|uniref:F-box domain-containing protein n=1 Tax=Hortaea werneckii TaxID=91943 RepID=A0A3M7FJJ9_HORWE|nr:hypothetical protein D0861_04513 [Hortaea werneckii]